MSGLANQELLSLPREIRQLEGGNGGERFRRVLREHLRRAVRPVLLRVLAVRVGGRGDVPRDRVAGRERFAQPASGAREVAALSRRRVRLNHPQRLAAFTYDPHLKLLLALQPQDTLELLRSAFSALPVL